MARDLSGKVAFITGASSGLGAALAREYALRGAAVVATGRRVERLDDLVAGIRASGGSGLAVGVDVTVDGDVVRAVERTLDRYGRIDHVHANAGFGVAGWSHKLTLDDYRRQFETNVFGVLRTVIATREALFSSGGHLAIMGSVTSYVHLPGSSPYSMSKSSLLALSHCLRHEFRPRGVKVTLIAPGFVGTEIRRVDNRGRLREEVEDPIPAWLLVDSDVAAKKIVRGVCRGRRVVIVSAHGRLAVFAQRHAPWLIEGVVKHFGVRARREPK